MSVHCVRVFSCSLWVVYIRTSWSSRCTAFKCSSQPVWMRFVFLNWFQMLYLYRAINIYRLGPINRPFPIGKTLQNSQFSFKARNSQFHKLYIMCTVLKKLNFVGFYSWAGRWMDLLCCFCLYQLEQSIHVFTVF